MAYKPMVKVFGEEKLCGNGLVFATIEEVLEYGTDLIGRWIMAEQVVPSWTDEAVNYTFFNGKLEATPEKMREYKVSDFNRTVIRTVFAFNLDSLLRKEFPEYNHSYKTASKKAYVVNPKNDMDCYFIEEVTE